MLREPVVIGILHRTKWHAGAGAPLIAAAAAAAEVVTSSERRSGSLPGSCSREAVAVIVINIQISRVPILQHYVIEQAGGGCGAAAASPGSDDELLSVEPQLA